MFDKRAVEKGQVRFHDVSFIEAIARHDATDRLRISVELTDFSVYYTQGLIDAIAADLKEGKSEVVCEQGQLWKVNKDKEGVVTRDKLTKHWTDSVDYWAVDFDYEIELWPSQIEAATRVTNTEDDLVVSLPTSAGKTRIAELCILRALANDLRVVYVTPLRALSAQVERDLRNTFQPLGFTVSSLYGASGQVGLDADTLVNRSIVVSTPEKLDFALRQDPDLLNDVQLIVLDEAHTIGPGEREVRYEVLVQRLLRRSDASTRRLACLSASRDAIVKAGAFDDNGRATPERLR